MAERKVAVVVHVFYQRLWFELATYLRNIPMDFSLFASVPGGVDASFISSSFPGARTFAVRNVGRDVAPFLQIIPELLEFELVCKIHSKFDDKWRGDALRSLLGSP